MIHAIRFSILTLTLIVLVGSAACTFTSLQTPRSNPPGKVSFGFHPSFIINPYMFDEEGSSSNSGVPASLTGILRVGLWQGGELGLNVGFLGGDINIKHSFLPYDYPFQVALIGGTGAYLWAFPHVNMGVLLGYNINEVVMPYAGYRQYLLLSTGAFPIGDIIVGFEFLNDKPVSIGLELDWPVSYLTIDSGSSYADLDSFIGFPTINIGINFHIWR